VVNSLPGTLRGVIPGYMPSFYTRFTVGLIPSLRSRPYEPLTFLTKAVQKGEEKRRKDRF